MESPVRSGENGAGGAEAENANNSSTSSSGSVSQQQQRQFEAKSYLERQVEELSCVDEEEAQEKVSQRLQLKHERAKKKRYVVYSTVTRWFDLRCFRFDPGFGWSPP